MRKILMILSAAVLGITLGGCGKTAEKTKEAVTEIKFSFWEPGMSHELEEALKIVVEGYEEIHPETKITLLSEPVETYQDMIKSGVVGDDLPDIESNHATNLARQYNAGLLVNISDSLARPSAYSDGESWKDTFDDELIKAADGKYIPYFGIELGIFYNKDIYRELGLKVPQTWDEFLNNCEQIQNAGKLPIAFMAQKTDACAWVAWDISGGLFAGKHLPNKNINVNGDNTITTYEVMRAVLNGEINFAEDAEYRNEYREYVKRMGEYLSYCGGYPGYEETVAKSMFLNGEAAHIQSGSWDIGGIVKNEDIGFEVGVFNFPLFTEEQTAYSGKRIKHRSEQCLAVTRSAYSEEGKLEKVIDFLQYLTSSDVYRTFIKNTAHLPVLKDVECADETKIFDYDGYGHDQVLIEYGRNELIYSILSGNTPELDDKYFKRMQEKLMEKACEYAEEAKLSAADGYYKNEKVDGTLNGN